MAQQDKKVTTKPTPKAKANIFADAILSICKDAPKRLVSELVEGFEGRGYKSLDDVKEADPKVVVYQLGATIRSVIRKQAVEYYGLSLKAITPLSSGDFSVIGLDIKEVYPNCEASFAKRFHKNLEEMGIKELSKVSHRGSPPLITIALQNTVRSADDIGLDGQSVFDALGK